MARDGRRAVLDEHRRAHRARHLGHAPHARRRRDAQRATHARRRAARDAALADSPREPHGARARGRDDLPAMPSFYGKPETLDDAIDTVVARVLDHLGRRARDRKALGKHDDAARRARAPARRARSTCSRRAPRRARSSTSFEPRLRDADLLALGALADARATRRGRRHVRFAIHARRDRPTARDRARRVASSFSAPSPSRASPVRAARACASTSARRGLEIAQVALGFGASELAGPIANARGLPIADDAQKKVKGQGDGRAPGAQAAKRSRARSTRRTASPSSRRPTRTQTVRRRHELEAIAEKVRAGERLDVRRRPRALPRAGSRSPSARSPTRCARRATATARTSTEHAHRGHERLRRVVPVLLVREARRGRARRAHDEARRGVGASSRRAWTIRRARSTSSTACTPACRSRTTRSSSRGFKRIKPDIHMKCFTAVEIHFFARALRHDATTRCSSGCARRGSTACPAAARRSSTPTCARASRTTRRPPTSTSRCTASRTAWACARTRRCSTGTSRRSSTASITCFACASCRTRRAGLQAFIPLAFHPDGNGMKNLPAPTAVDDLRTIAVSRLLLDNVDHVKAYWVEHDAEVAQIALRFGADDLDGTIVHETIYHAAGSRVAAGRSRYDELVRLIREAGRIPVERDTLYNVVREHPRAALPEAAAEGARPQGGQAPRGALVTRRTLCASRARRVTSTRVRSATRSTRARSARVELALARRRARSRACSPKTRPTSRSCRSPRPRTIGDASRSSRGLRSARAARCAASSSSPSARSTSSKSSRSTCRRARASSSRGSSCASAARREPRLVGARAGARRIAFVGGDARRARHRRSRARASKDASRTRSTSADAWCEWTGLAVRLRRLVRRAGAVSREDERARSSAKLEGLERRDAIADEHAARIGLAEPRCALPHATRSATTSATTSARGLERFYDEAAHAGSCRARVRFFDEDRVRRAAAVARHAARARGRRRAPLAPPKASASLARGVASSISGSPPTPCASRKHPHDVVTYIVDRNVNYTNVCTTSCRFCAFYRPVGHPEGYVLSREVLGKKLQEVVDAGGVQILLQGGLNPELAHRVVRGSLPLDEVASTGSGFTRSRRRRSSTSRASRRSACARCSSGSRAAGLDSRARRRRGDPRRSRAPQDREGQVHERRVARRHARRAPHGPSLERDDDVRHRRHARAIASRTSSRSAISRTRRAASPRSSAGTSSTSSGTRIDAGRPRHACSTCARRRSRASCSTTSITSARRGSRKVPTSARSRCASARTTSAA